MTLLTRLRASHEFDRWRRPIALGHLLVVVGMFLPWAHFPESFVHIYDGAYFGIALSDIPLGPIMVVFSCIAGCGVIFSYPPTKEIGKLALWTGLGELLILTIMCFFLYTGGYSLMRGFGVQPIGGGRGALGIGIYVTAIGLCLAIASTVFSVSSRPAAPRIVKIIVGATLLLVLIASVVVNLKPASVEIAATLTPSTLTQVTGTLRPWDNTDPTLDRQIVLCELVNRAQNPYACKVSTYTAVTDERGQFEIKNVQPGEYLIFYDSGMADFEQGVQRWTGTTIQIGKWVWLSTYDFFGDEPNGSFILCGGGLNEKENFYRNYVELTLGGSGSPFMVAHNVEAALAYDRERDGFTLPSNIFQPVVITVDQGFSSHIEFIGLWCGSQRQKKH